MSLKERVIKDTLIYTAANYIAMALGIIVSIATKALLGPIGSGYWAVMKVFGSYGEYSDLGTRNAMIREIPQAIGAAQSERAESMQNSAFAFTSLSCFVSAIAIFIFAKFTVQDGLLRHGLYVTAILVIATQIYNFSLTLLRTLKKVKELSGVIVINMLFVLVFSILGARWHGVFGMALGMLAATALSAWNAYAWGGMRFHWHWDFGVIKRLISIGLPMVVVSYALVTFLCIDTLMIGKMLGMAELGFYTIALMSVQQIGSLGRFSQIILIPHIQERYGKTGRLEDASALFLRSTRILAYAMPWIIAAVIFFVPMLVHLLLPKFIPGLPAMKILVIGYYFVAVNELTVNAAYTADKQRRIIPFMFVVIAAAAALNYAFIKSGWGIQGVALATSLSYFVYFAVTLPFSYAGQMRPGETLKLVAGITAVFIYFCAAAMIADRAISIPSGIIVEALAKFALFALLFSPMLYRLEKEERLAGAIGGILQKKWAMR